MLSQRVRDAIDVLSSLLVAGAAVVMVTAYLHDRRQATAGLLPLQVDNWQDWHEQGIRIGAENPRMVIAAFMDFTCPFCADLAPVLDSVLTRFPQDVAVQFHHFPLSNRESSMPSAIAAECADRQGRFHAMYDALYAQMDSIGVKAWVEFAVDAEVPDVGRFTQCLELPAETFVRIRAGQALGNEIGVFGTPTVWVNGVQFTARNLDAFTRKAEELGIGR